MREPPHRARVRSHGCAGRVECCGSEPAGRTSRLTGRESDPAGCTSRVTRRGSGIAAAASRVTGRESDLASRARQTTRCARGNAGRARADDDRRCRPRGSARCTMGRAHHPAGREAPRGALPVSPPGAPRGSPPSPPGSPTAPPGSRDEAPSSRFLPITGPLKLHFVKRGVAKCLSHQALGRVVETLAPRFGAPHASQPRLAVTLWPSRCGSMCGGANGR